MSARQITLILIAAIALFTISSSVYFVDERQKTLLLKLGQIQEANSAPGLHFKVPFVTDVRRFDGRILSLDTSPARYLTGEKKNVIVDSFILWRVTDASDYFRAMGGNEENARVRLSQIIKDGLRAEFGRRTIQEVVSGNRNTLVNDIMTDANQRSDEFGIEVVDIRIKRIDLPSEVSNSIFARMEAERERVAKDLRSRGAEEAEKIRSDADRQRTVILAEARRQAESLRGEGDAEATEIYANAYNQNEDFYSFYRRLGAYQNVFNQDDILVIEPKGDFFNQFKTLDSIIDAE